MKNKFGSFKIVFVTLGGFRGALEKYTKLKSLYMMNILLILTVVLVAMAIVTGIYKADEVEWAIDFTHPHFNSFEIGITNRNYEWDNGDREQELRFGLFIVSISVSFFRNSA